ncbi:MAG: sensor histidine kinase, partial [Lachnospiraceae bacterium]|nr:sensor histidine kinase [Lachnospiraceae bacterium]
MKSLLQIYGKYIAVTWGIILLLFFGNIGALFYIMHSHAMEDRVVPSSLRSLEKQLFAEWEQEGILALQPEEEALLQSKGFVFLFVLDDDGNVIYKWQCPDTFPNHYTAGEIASFTRWYLQDYPVKVWRGDYGLLVAGYEKGSVWKYNIEYSMSFINRYPMYLRIILWVNLSIILFLIGYIGYRFYRSLQPLSEGIDMLSRNQKVHLSERGSLSTLAAQLNKTSDILEKQRVFLERRDSARTEWIAGVSHDIRTPLAVIMGYADQLENDETLSPRQRECAESIKIQSMNIRKLIEDLNLTSKLEYHMQPLRTKEFYPSALLRGIVAEMLNGRHGEQYEISLSIEDEFSAVRMQGDSDLIA